MFPFLGERKKGGMKKGIFGHNPTDSNQKLTGSFNSRHAPCKMRMWGGGGGLVCRYILDKLVEAVLITYSNDDT
jgi:hypothetical protein